jgi:hypothetical protein
MNILYASLGHEILQAKNFHMVTTTNYYEPHHQYDQEHIYLFQRSFWSHGKKKSSTHGHKMIFLVFFNQCHILVECKSFKLLTIHMPK